MLVVYSSSNELSSNLISITSSQVQIQCHVFIRVRVRVTLIVIKLKFKHGTKRVQLSLIASLVMLESVTYCVW